MVLVGSDRVDFQHGLQACVIVLVVDVEAISACCSVR
jgi:hypothetical protein